MQEFETISASSYDPSALAAKLTAKAAEGWSVVAIVPTGGDVTAFLSRGGASTAHSTEAATTAAVVAAVPVETASSSEVAAAETEPVAETPAEAAVETPTAVGEPSGWALAPEPATPSIAETTTVQPTTTYEPSPSYQPSTSYEPSVPDTSFQPTLGGVGAASPAPAAAPVTPEPAPAAAPAVPAGWYADPAGRFELRYWDGGTWTEHVSRAGQQFTDPPVA
jgi:Protein of unknown function (DUF2510)